MLDFVLLLLLVIVGCGLVVVVFSIVIVAVIGSGVGSGGGWLVGGQGSVVLVVHENWLLLVLLALLSSGVDCFC